MPDLDYLPRSMGASWRHVGALLESGEPTGVVADAVEKALAEFIRGCGPTGQLAHGCSELVEAIRNGTSVDMAVQRLGPMWLTAQRQVFVDAATVRQLLKDLSRHEPAAPDPKLLVKDALELVVERSCLGVIAPELIGVRYTADEFEDCRSEVLDLVRFDQLASQVSRGVLVRAPHRRHDPVGTERLLDQSLDELRGYGGTHDLRESRLF